MKRYLIGLIIVLFLFVSASADHRAVIARKNAGVTPDCSEDFNTANTDDVDANTEFDDETDTATTTLAILDNVMRYDAGTNGQVAYVHETTCPGSATEVTIKFKIEFEDILDVDGDTSDTLYMIRFRDSNSDVGRLELRTDGSGDIDLYRVWIGNGDVMSNEVTMKGAGLAADTQYDAACYYNEAASGEFACVINPGVWAEATAGMDNQVDDGIANVLVGGAYNEWGDGGTDTFVEIDDFELYKSDQMP